LAQFHEEEVAPALEGLLALDIPIVAQIQGICIGGGLEIACCADIRIAGQGAMFGAPIAKLGMPMASRELAIVVRSVGEATVREMLLEAKLLDAAEMKSRGWLQRMVADDAVLSEAQATAQRITQFSPQAARLNKRALRHLNMPFFKLNKGLSPEDIALSAINSGVNSSFYPSSFYAYAASAEHREGIDAFLEKRPAKF
jgi:enoyl-CoA hydratase